MLKKYKLFLITVLFFTTIVSIYANCPSLSQMHLVLSDWKRGVDLDKVINIDQWKADPNSTDNRILISDLTAHPSEEKNIILYGALANRYALCKRIVRLPTCIYQVEFADTSLDWDDYIYITPDYPNPVVLTSYFWASANILSPFTCLSSGNNMCVFSILQHPVTIC